MASASSAGAERYASESFKQAQAAQTALDAELKAQDEKWVKSYDRARELSVDAKTAADKAAADAASGRERAELAAKKENAAAARRVKLAAAVRIKDVAPVYPAVAKSARVTGDVVIEATIDDEGKVADARGVKTVPLLDQAALDAVRQWEYRPSLLNGVPTPVVTTVTVKFTRP